MSVLSINNLCKNYESFCLDHISFEMEEGRIMGFIGRNGAGKTTTLKSLLNFVHPDSGNITFFGMNFKENEFEIKQKIGFVSGGIDFYPTKKLRTITDVTRRFYQNWDDAAYRRYMQLFNLNEDKTPNQLSAGMKVKYSLALALSHNAQLLLLDEPTSGLDPVSRDDLLDVFLTLAEEGISIFFSTHITSDLDKCADDITYIKNGKIISSMDMQSFLHMYYVVELRKEELTDSVEKYLIGCKKSKNGYTALVLAENKDKLPMAKKEADLESIMVHLEKE